MNTKANQERQKQIYLSAPDVDETDRSALLQAFDGGWIASVGPQIDAFEEELASYCQAESVLATSSGTAALHLGLLLEGVGPGDEVIVQSATFAATAFSVTYCGATPVFIDSEASSWCLDPNLLYDTLNERAQQNRLPKAVMPVDLYGATANYQEIRSICEQFDVALIRDGAEALGSVSTDGPVGSGSNLTVLSFNGNKIITTSSGGALLGSAAKIEKARYLATQARQPVRHYLHSDIGHNYRLSNLLAGLGRAQLKNIESKIARRSEIAELYRKALPQLEWCEYTNTPRPNRWLSVGLFDPKLEISPMAICDEMNAANIETRPAWNPMHKQPVFAKNEWIRGDGTADELFERGICLPSSSAMTNEDVNRVIDTLGELIAKHTATRRAVSPR